MGIIRKLQTGVRATVLLLMIFVTLMPGTVLALGPGYQKSLMEAGLRYTNVNKDTCGNIVSLGGEGTSVATKASQDAIAKIIMGIAKTDGLNQDGAIIGLMVGLDESGLKIYANTNVPLSLSNPDKQATGHNYDSVGVFQQRPSTGWSTYGTGPSAINNKDAVYQLMDPAYNAEAFFGGATGKDAPSALKKGLINLNGWEKMEPWMAAQKVQISGTPDGSNYKAHYKTAQIDSDMSGCV